MKHKLLLFTFFLAANVYSQKGNCHFPFPNHSIYQRGVILPNVSQQVMDDSSFSFFQQWKDRYIKFKNYGNERCAYVCSNRKSTGKESENECVSEGMGYGMIIVVQMTDSNNSKENQKLYNELFRFYRRHPSTRDKEGSWDHEQSLLMGYAVNGIQSDNEVYDRTAASDGDIDIAFSLLLANTQWSSNGDINYLNEAHALIKAIYNEDINRHTKIILTSNNNEDGNTIENAMSQNYYDIRTSDFMPSELKAFDAIFKEGNFLSVVDSNYKVFFTIQQMGSKGVGLVPDFVQHIGYEIQKNGYKIVIPQKKYEETAYDGAYFYNACRVPWRIATDYIISGDIRAKKFVEPINEWISLKYKNDPNKIGAGYRLNGNEILTAKEKDTLMMSFVCPLAVSAMVDKRNQPWLNKLWDCIIGLPIQNKVADLEYGYYENTIKMLNLIIISGNYWSVEEGASKKNNEQQQTR